MIASLASLSTWTGLLLLDLTSQIRTVVSWPPDMTRLSSWPEKRTAFTRPVWEWAVEAEPRRRRGRAVVTSQRKTVRSPPEEAKRSLREETLKERTS